MGPNGPFFELYTLLAQIMRVIDSRFTFVHKGILIITQGCIGVSEQGLLIELID